MRPWSEDQDRQIEALIAGHDILLANYVAASQDAAERTIAPNDLARAEKELRGFMAEPA